MMVVHDTVHHLCINLESKTLPFENYYLAHGNLQPIPISETTSCLPRNLVFTFYPPKSLGLLIVDSQRKSTFKPEFDLYFKSLETVVGIKWTR